MASDLAAERAHGEAALRALDKVLAEQPHKVGHDFSETTRCLTAYRAAIIGNHRNAESDATRERLSRLNSVIGVVIGGHFPLGPIPWPHIEKAREALERLVKGRTRTGRRKAE